MSTDTTDTTTDEPDTGTDEPDTDTTTTDEVDAWTPPDKETYDKLSARAVKAVERAQQRDKLLREAQAEIKKLKDPDATDTEPDPIAQANVRLVKASARTALATAGVTDRGEQAAVLAVLNLSDVEVDEDGEVDTDAIDTRIGELRRIFGGKAAAKRAPRLDTRDKGGSGGGDTNPDSARRRAFLSGR